MSSLLILDPLRHGWGSWHIIMCMKTTIQYMAILACGFSKVLIRGGAGCNLDFLKDGLLHYRVVKEVL